MVVVKEKNEGKLRWDLLPYEVVELLLKKYQDSQDTVSTKLLILRAFVSWWYQRGSLESVLFLLEKITPTEIYTPKEVTYFQTVSEVLQYGASKYNDRNWERGMLWSQCYNSGMRHLIESLHGKIRDEESDLPHLSHFLCNIFFLVEYAKTCPEFDNRPGGDNAKV